MDVVVYGKVENRSVFEEIYPEDRIIEKWDLSDTELHTDILSQYTTACVLLLDGDYGKMLSKCLAYGIPVVRILDVERYSIYKKIEEELSGIKENSWAYIRRLYYGYQKIIRLYEYDNRVIKSCKEDFVKKIDMMEIFSENF